MPQGVYPPIHRHYAQSVDNARITLFRVSLVANRATIVAAGSRWQRDALRSEEQLSGVWCCVVPVPTERPVADPSRLRTLLGSGYGRAAVIGAWAGLALIGWGVRVLVRGQASTVKAQGVAGEACPRLPCSGSCWGRLSWTAHLFGSRGPPAGWGLVPASGSSSFLVP